MTTQPTYNPHPIAHKAATLLAVLTLAGLAFGFVYALQQPALGTIHFYGEYQNVDSTQLKSAIQTWKTRKVWQMDVAEFARDLAEVSWLKSVAIEQVGFDTFHITVSEQAPMFRWQDQQLVSEEGRVFAVGERTWQTHRYLPTLAAPATILPDIAAITQTLFSEDIPYPLNAVNITPGGAVRIQLETYPELIFNVETFDAEFARFLAWQPTWNNQVVANAEYMDFRHPDGFAVKYAER